MPLIRHKLLEPDGELGLWLIEESEAELHGQLDLRPNERLQLDGIRGHRRTEWLAVRCLVHRMSGRLHRAPLVKNDFGKPHLYGSAWYISVSHSRELAAAVAASDPVGVDIQRIVGKIERLAHKFMRPVELDSLNAEWRLWQMHVYWCAKEALYKAYGRRQLDFCQHILVDPFPYQPDGGVLNGYIIKDTFRAHYRLQYRMYEDYMLVYAREIPD